MLVNRYFLLGKIVLAVMTCLLLLSACGSFKTISERTYPAIWQVHSKNPNAGKIWLFGTIHTLPYGKASTRFRGPSNFRRRFVFPTWLSPEARNALSIADVVVLEIVGSSEAKSTRTRFETSTRAVLDNLDDASRQDIITAAELRGLSIEKLEQLSAADLLATFSLVGERNNRILNQPGVEDWLRIFARGSQLRLRGLESIEDRITAITETFKALNVTEHERVVTEYLAATLSERPDPKQDLKTLYNRWISGDSILTERQSELFASTYPEIYTAFVTYRNKLWIPRIQGHINSGKDVFIAVGEAHLNGPDNVRELLEAAGYQVKRL